MKNSHLFWWGCLGAVLPELLRFFKLVAAGQSLPTLNWPLYIGLFVLFVLAAGAFTVAWKAETPFKAIWVGASFPTLVATLVQVAPALPKG
jgi:CDP-diglyceride synthetase